MIKLTVSCCNEEELKNIIKTYSPIASKIKTPKIQRGKYLKVYIFLELQNLL